MNRALGVAGLVVALGAAVLGIAVVLYGIRSRRPAQMRMALPYAVIVLIGAVTSVLAMQLALAQRDYSVLYVAEHGSSTTPLLFNIASMLSALEGSILLWGLILDA